jgi:ribosomal protein S18
VAKQRKRPQRRRDRKTGPGSGRRKPCPYCREKVPHVDYKDVSTLRRFVSDKGKIRSRRITGACRKHQSQIESRLDEVSHQLTDVLKPRRDAEEGRHELRRAITSKVPRRRRAEST